jgi:hypothetical protein
MVHGRQVPSPALATSKPHFSLDMSASHSLFCGLLMWVKGLEAGPTGCPVCVVPFCWPSWLELLGIGKVGARGECEQGEDFVS